MLDIAEAFFEGDPDVLEKEDLKDGVEHDLGEGGRAGHRPMTMTAPFCLTART